MIKGWKKVKNRPQEGRYLAAWVYGKTPWAVTIEVDEEGEHGRYNPETDAFDDYHSLPKKVDITYFVYGE